MLYYIILFNIHSTIEYWGTRTRSRHSGHGQADTGIPMAGRCGKRCLLDYIKSMTTTECLLQRHYRHLVGTTHDKITCSFINGTTTTTVNCFCLVPIIPTMCAYYSTSVV